MKKQQLYGASCRNKTLSTLTCYTLTTPLGHQRLTPQLERPPQKKIPRRSNYILAGVFLKLSNIMLQCPWFYSHRTVWHASSTDGRAELHNVGSAHLPGGVRRPSLTTISIFFLPHLFSLGRPHSSYACDSLTMD